MSDRARGQAGANSVDGWEGARAQLLGLYPDQSCSPASGLLSLGLGLLGSCQGLTGTWLGVGQGQAVGREPFWQRWGRALAGWGTGRNRVLRVASGPQPSSVPVLWVARPCCPHLPSALYLGPPLPPRLLAPLPSSGMTQDDAVLGGRQGWDTHFPFWPLPHSSNHHQPSAPRVPGQRQPCTFCPAWGPNCTGIYFLTHLPFSRCGLLGKGSCVLEPDTCMAGCDAVRPRWGGYGV